MSQKTGKTGAAGGVSGLVREEDLGPLEQKKEQGRSQGVGARRELNCSEGAPGAASEVRAVGLRPQSCPRRVGLLRLPGAELGMV